MPNYRELLQQVKSEIDEVDVTQARELLAADDRPLVVDVREKDEVRDGVIPGALSVPRGFLEMQIEQKVTDKSAPVVLYCAGGTRSALAAKTLADLGYTHVESATPGFVRWKDLGFPIEKPPQLTDARARALLPAHPPARGGRGRPGQAARRRRCCSSARAGWARPAALYLAAAGVGTLGLVDDERRRRLEPAAPDPPRHRAGRHGQGRVGAGHSKALNPDVKVVQVPGAPHSENVDAHLRDGFDVVVDGCDNFPTRYLVNDAAIFRQAERPRLIFRFEGQATSSRRQALLPLPLPEPPPPELAPSCAEAGVLGVLPGVIGSSRPTRRSS